MGGENYDLVYQHLIKSYEDVLEHYLYFVWFVIFLNVIPFQFCGLYLSNSMVLSLLGTVTSSLKPWWFDAKITSEKTAALMKGGFL